MPILVNPHRFGVVAGSAYAAAVLADSPLAHWRKGDLSGSTMADGSGNARDGLYVGSPTLGATGLVTGDTDTSVDYNGSTQYAYVPDAAWMDATNLTVECIMRVDSLSGDRRIVLRDNIGGGAGSGGSSRCWQMLTQSGKLTAAVWNTSAALAFFAGPTTLNTGTTYHLAMTHDGTNAKLWINGVIEATAALAGNTQVGTQQIGIGSGLINGSLSGPVDGRIDEVAIYGTALSSGRLLAHKTAAGL